MHLRSYAALWKSKETVSRIRCYLVAMQQRAKGSASCRESWISDLLELLDLGLVEESEDIGCSPLSSLGLSLGFLRSRLLSGLSSRSLLSSIFSLLVLLLGLLFLLFFLQSKSSIIDQTYASKWCFSRSCKPSKPPSETLHLCITSTTTWLKRLPLWTPGFDSGETWQRHWSCS